MDFGINIDPIGAIANFFASRQARKATEAAANAQLQATRETNEQNAALAREQMEWSSAQIDKQNEYNSPVQQMARYQAAGLNPNLIYGNGASSAGNQMSLPSYQRAEMQTPDVLSAGIARAQNIIQLASMFTSLRLQKSELDSRNLDNESKAIENQFKRDSYEARLMKCTSEAAGVQILNSKMIAERALVRQKTLSEQLQQLKIKEETANLKVTRDYIRKQIDALESDIRFNDSVIALNEGKLTQMEFQNMYTLEQMKETSARIGLIGQQRVSLLANDVASGRMTRSGEVSSFAEATGKNLLRSLSSFSLGDLLPLGKASKLLRGTPKARGRRSTFERYGPSGEFLGSTIGSYQDVY